MDIQSVPEPAAEASKAAAEEAEAAEAPAADISSTDAKADDRTRREGGGAPAADTRLRRGAGRGDLDHRRTTIIQSSGRRRSPC